MCHNVYTINYLYNVIDYKYEGAQVQYYYYYYNYYNCYYYYYYYKYIITITITITITTIISIIITILYYSLLLLVLLLLLLLLSLLYGRFPYFQSSDFQFERLKSEQINCGCFFYTMPDFNVPGSRPKKTR